MAIESINTVAASAVQQNIAQQGEQSQQVQRSEHVETVSAQTQSTANVGNKEEQEQLAVEQLEAAVEKMNELMKDGQRSLSFSVDKDLDEVVVKVLDKETDELIRQIPNEEALEFAKHIEGLVGVIFNERA